LRPLHPKRTFAARFPLDSFGHSFT